MSESHEQCLICKKITHMAEVGTYTHDGEAICSECCDWLQERNVELGDEI